MEATSWKEMCAPLSYDVILRTVLTQDTLSAKLMELICQLTGWSPRFWDINVLSLYSASSSPDVSVCMCVGVVYIGLNHYRSMASAS